MLKENLDSTLLSLEYMETNLMFKLYIVNLLNFFSTISVDISVNIPCFLKIFKIPSYCLKINQSKILEENNFLI